MWDDPRRGALHDVELLDLGLDGGHELDRRSAGADRGHPLTAQVVHVVPARRVERRALEPLEARHVRHPRLGERAEPRHEHAGAEESRARLDAPASGLLVPVRAGDLAIQADVRAHAEALRAVAQVGVDLGLGRVGAAPAGVRRERERVQMRRHVAGAARIGVVVPGAADVVPRSSTTKSSMPSCLRRIAMPRPEKPLPTIARPTAGSSRLSRRGPTPKTRL